jgi:tRNA G18 (ribose-2'-O)-methylase SpoU
LAQCPQWVDSGLCAFKERASPSYDTRMDDETKSKPSVRKRAEEIKAFRCKNLIAVIENPTDIKNIGTVIRNVNALGVEKVYVVDRRSPPATAG